jgi:hypothetical protein
MRDSIVKNWISDRVVVPTVQGLDKRIKRMVALASLFGFLFNRRHRSKELEMRLSKTMDLATNSSSLTLPMIHHEMVWDSVERRNPGEVRTIKKKFCVEQTHNVTNAEAKTYAQVLVGIMPTCLFYDSVEVILQDLIHLFESIPFILGESKPA